MIPQTKRLAKGRAPERRRFSIGHELGHLLIPSHKPHPNHPFECSLSDFHVLDLKGQNRHRRIEAEANRFAAQLLMPPKRVRRAIGRSNSSLESLVAMAGDFGVSKEAMARAWVDAHREPVAVIIAHNGYLERSYRNEDFPWLNIRNGERLKPALHRPHGREAGRQHPPRQPAAQQLVNHFNTPPDRPFARTPRDGRRRKNGSSTAHPALVKSPFDKLGRALARPAHCAHGARGRCRSTSLISGSLLHNPPELSS